MRLHFKHARDFVHECHDRVINQGIYSEWPAVLDQIKALQALVPSWTANYTTASASFRRSNGTMVKITRGHEVFVDIRLKGSMSYKSQKIDHDSASAAVETFRSVIMKYCAH